jgi:ribonuclease HI
VEIRKINSAEIWTDGACVPNPGHGGWAAVIRLNGQEEEISGSEPNTTSNRMEMAAAVCAIESLPEIPDKIILHTDSQYLCHGFMSWRHKWKRNGWKMSKKLNASEPKNLDLWKVLDRLAESVEIELVWIRGHNGQAENERVDKLSMKAALANVSPAVISEWNRQMWKRKADRNNPRMTRRYRGGKI